MARKPKPVAVERHTCARCGHMYRETRRCSSPVVREKLGEYICYYCCKRCKHHTTTPLCGAIGCELWKKGDPLR